MKKNYSSLLKPDLGTQQNPGAAAFFNNTLWYIGNGHNSTVWMTYRSLSHLDPTDSDGESDYWKNVVLDDQKILDGNISIDTQFQPSLVVANGYMYFIWIEANDKDQGDKRLKQEKNSVWAIRMSPAHDDKIIKWSSPVRLKDFYGDPLQVYYSNLCFRAWGNYLIGCYHDDRQTNFLAFDTEQWPNPGQPSNEPVYWKPTKYFYNEFYGKTQWPHAGLPTNQMALGNEISMDWFAVDGDNIYFVMSFYSQQDKKAYIVKLMQMRPVSEWPEDYTKGFDIFYHWNVEVWSDISLAVHLKTDPAGRMRAYYGNVDKKLTYRVLATNEVSSDHLMWGKFGAGHLLYNTDQELEQAPVPCFIWHENKNMTTDPESGKPASVSEVYEFVLFKSDGINLKFSHFGRAIRIPNYETYNPNATQADSGTTIYTLTGIVDSGIPLPASNILNRPTNYSKQQLGTLIYGSTNSETTQHSTSHNWSVGFKSSGSASNGVGAAWDIAFNYGQGQVSGNTQQAQLSDQKIVETEVELETKQLIAAGTLFANTVSFHRDAYHFYDYPLEGSHPKLASNAPEVTTIWVSYNNDAIVGTFQPYNLKVGSLRSYTKEALNRKMRRLYQTYKANHPDGPIHKYNYDNYFEEVIANPNNTVSFSPDANAKNANKANNFLDFAWSSVAEDNEYFNAIHTNFTENSWQFNSSVYAGVSFNVKVSFFGLGEGEQGKFLAGGTYAMSSNSKSSNGIGWGIKVSYELQSPGNQPKPGEVLSFNWRLYLLKANQRWTDELLAFGDADSFKGLTKNEIDPNAQPWRISFVVDDNIEVVKDTPKIAYIDDAQRVQLMTYEDGSWQNMELPESAPTAQGHIAYYNWERDPAGFSRHLIFQGTDNHLYELRQYVTTEVWDLYKLTDQPIAASSPKAYIWNYDINDASSQHIIFRDQQNQIQELWSFGTTDGSPDWQLSNLSAATKSGAVQGTPSPFIWTNDANDTKSSHVVALTGPTQILELWRKSGVDQDSNIWKASTLNVSNHQLEGNLAGFTSFYYNNQQGAYIASEYIAAKTIAGELLIFKNSETKDGTTGWQSELITPPEPAMSSPVGISRVNTATMATDHTQYDVHLFYRGPKGQVWVLAKNSIQDEWGKPKAINAQTSYKAASDPQPFISEQDSSVNVFFTTTSGQIVVFTFDDERAEWEATALSEA